MAIPASVPDSPHAARLTAGLDAPRAPTAPPGAPLYESHYLTAADPAGGRALWLRYTAHKEPGQEPRGQLWCTWFAAAGAPVARRTVAAVRLKAPPAGAWAQIGGAWIGPRHVQGELEDCAWSLGWDQTAAPLAYLPARWLYDRRLPRSNGAAIVPDATFSGSLLVAGETVDLAGWRGMVGHNWGADHADRWLWLHVPGLGHRDPEGWLDMVLVRVRLGPLLTPWLPGGGLWVDGDLRPITVAERVRGLRVIAGQEGIAVELPRLPGGGLGVKVSLPAERVAHWDYAGPRGGARHVRNCSVASAVIAVGGSPPSEVAGTAALEIGL